MTWSFRLHFALSERQRIDAGNEGSHPITIPGLEVHLKLKGPGSAQDGTGPPIRDSDELQLIGSGFSTQRAATEAALLWQRKLTVALASTHIGANLGDRSFHASYITPDGQRWLRPQLGLAAEDPFPIIGDRLGICVSETESRPIFAMSTAKPLVVYPISTVDAALVSLTEADRAASLAEQAAYDMFATSFFLPSSDARFITLMMAMEALIERDERGLMARDLSDDFISRTKQADLDEREAQSLISGPAHLKRESIGQAGRRLTATLSPRTYDDEPPDRFFARCYTLRSLLVHGDDDRPDLAEVNARCPHLERLIADLLSGPLVASADAVIPPAVRGIAMRGRSPSAD